MSGPAVECCLQVYHLPELLSLGRTVFSFHICQSHCITNFADLDTVLLVSVLVTVSYISEHVADIWVKFCRDVGCGTLWGSWSMRRMRVSTYLQLHIMYWTRERSLGTTRPIILRAGVGSLLEQMGSLAHLNLVFLRR